MLQASVLGSATSSGLLYHSRHDCTTSSSRSNLDIFGDRSTPSTIGRSLTPIAFSPKEDEQVAEEELVWFSRTVLWSRGAEVYRKYTFEHEREDVSRAAFVWFKISDIGQDGRSRGKVREKPQKLSDTFGPFHHSQLAQWGAPRTSSTNSTSSPSIQRTLMVILQTRAHIYFPSGEDIIVHLPFPIDGVWALPQGGCILQRALEKRELRRMGKGNGQASGSMLRGINQTSASMLDDLVDLEDENIRSLPRLYTLDRSFDEPKMIVEGHVDGRDDTSARFISPPFPPSASDTILHVCRYPYPFVILYDQFKREVVLCHRISIPPLPEPPPPTARTMRPEDVLRQPDPPPQPRPSRPSLHRNPSSFASTKERRISGNADPLDRTQRRAPRLSRGVERDALPSGTGELQAVLDPPPYIGSSITAPPKARNRTRGLSTTSAVNGESNRRTSGASALLRQDMTDPLGKMALNVAAERDLRETTMMMGLDREEEGIRSDLVLERVWVWKPPRLV